jgi:hypothetical protein
MFIEVARGGSCCHSYLSDFHIIGCMEIQIFMNGVGRAWVMWSTVVMFVLTFAILGLLLGFAEIYNSSEGDTDRIGSPGEIAGSDGNSTFAAGQEESMASTGS